MRGEWEADMARKAAEKEDDEDLFEEDDVFGSDMRTYFQKTSKSQVLDGRERKMGEETSVTTPL